MHCLYPSTREIVVVFQFILIFPCCICHGNIVCRLSYRLIWPSADVTIILLSFFLSPSFLPDDRPTSTTYRHLMGVGDRLHTTDALS
eukprot:c16787_g1_i1 orf=92-352(-)